MNDFDIINSEKQSDDLSIRPENLDDFVGQEKLKQNLKVYIKSAQMRAKSLDHILFSGPPGLGKTTLARLMANYMNGRFHQIAAPNLSKPGDLAKLLTSIEKNDIVFIDEIHRLTLPVEEVLYSAMEDFLIDITISEGMGASSIQINLPHFTLIGATTKPGSLSAPLRDRFGIQERLDFYSQPELEEVLKRAAHVLGCFIEDSVLGLIASRSRRTPRVALRLLKRVIDFATVMNQQGQKVIIENLAVEKAFYQLEIDALGLTALDRKMMETLYTVYDGGPAGLKAIAAVLSEDVTTLEDFLEPYLVQIGFIQRTQRGRVLSNKALEYCGYTPRKKIAEEDLLFGE